MSEYKAISLPNATVGSVSSRADRSVRFSVESGELSVEERSVILGLHGIAVSVLITPIADGEIETVEVEKSKETKSPSTRLRGVFFLLWKQGGQVEPFESFYSAQMEKILEHYKSKIRD